MAKPFVTTSVHTNACARDYSGSRNSLPNVGLCFSRLGLDESSRRVAGGLPSTLRAADFTAFTARNGFAFFFFAIVRRKKMTLQLSMAL